MSNCDTQEVNARAVTYAQRSAGSGLKKGNKLGKAMQSKLSRSGSAGEDNGWDGAGQPGLNAALVRQYSEIPVIVETVET